MGRNCLALTGGAVLWAALLLCAAGGAGAAERLLVAAGDSPTLGPSEAPLTVVEFVDYQ